MIIKNDVKWTIQIVDDILTPEEAKECKEVAQLVVERREANNPWAWVQVRVIGEIGPLNRSVRIGCVSEESEEEFKKSELYAAMQLDVIELLEDDVRYVDLIAQKYNIPRQQFKNMEWFRPFVMKDQCMANFDKKYGCPTCGEYCVWGNKQ